MLNHRVRGGGGLPRPRPPPVQTSWTPGLGAPGGRWGPALSWPQALRTARPPTAALPIGKLANARQGTWVGFSGTRSGHGGPSPTQGARPACGGAPGVRGLGRRAGARPAGAGPFPAFAAGLEDTLCPLVTGSGSTRRECRWPRAAPPRPGLGPQVRAEDADPRLHTQGPSELLVGSLPVGSEMSKQERCLLLKVSVISRAQRQGAGGTCLLSIRRCASQGPRPGPQL